MGNLYPTPFIEAIPPAISCMLEPSSWYAVRTRARHEKTVATQLEGKGVKAFLPQVEERHRWSDRQQTVWLPLFPGYVFVHVVPTVEAYLQVLQTPGVAHFVGIGRRGVPISDKEIEDIQSVQAHKHPCAPFPYLAMGQRVRIRGGCLDGLEGILLGQNSDRTLVLSVKLIQRSMAVRIEGYDVEVI